MCMCTSNPCVVSVEEQQMGWYTHVWKLMNLLCTGEHRFPCLLYLMLPSTIWGPASCLNLTWCATCQNWRTDLHIKSYIMKVFIYFYIYVYSSVCVCICVYALRGQKACWVPWSWSYRQLWVTDMVTENWVLVHWRINQPLRFVFKQMPLCH